MGSESSSASCCHQGTCCLHLIMVMVLVLWGKTTSFVFC
jgi:hypothetical protein